MSKAEDLSKKLTYNRKSFWTEAKKTEQKSAFKFAEGYKKFLDEAKTEREAIRYYEKIFKEKGFKNIDEKNAGKKVFRIARAKNAAIAIIGKKPISEGVNLIVSHVDAPRVDLKQSPLHEDSTTKLGIMKTHYYGGVKKYQWMSTPLALHGVVIKNDGTKVDISIGENDADPVFVMPDLLPHLARKVQYTKKIGEAVDAAKMNLVFNSIPYPDKDAKEAIKLNALSLLNEKYGIVEADFLSAELELVPAGKSRDAGIDKSMVLGYGQDDRICAYTSAEAVFDAKKDLERTAIVYLADKEEIGSDGNTGAKSIFIVDFIADLLAKNVENADSMTLRKTLLKSQILSADVNAAINPNFPSVHEKENAVHLGFGVSVTKFTGSGGKGGSNDANAEFNSKIIKIFNAAKVNWQIGALGKVDEGGGGTIAKFMAEHGAEVIDCGPGVLGMHSLYELTSKADIYSAYKAYKTFFEKA
ncbi:MAG: aminopeptidase [Candidatus Cloacimonetes bacterium]|nr:aminopeptidase [Candidatus Cloacimonadota bacterium]MCF7814277.1 aminopeptidase [Candidatus Cloacimonadota bacterium]MCF7868938.1 aminopeptidase [Candidatus Cloacimonadota bacterium]MCF7884318.1 aminopeptidase [Candidatus Cloacimonadota bacterium]